MADITVFSVKSDSDGAELLFNYHKKHISVSIFPSTPPFDDHSSLYQHPDEDRFIDLLGRAVSTRDDDKHEEIIDDVLTAILDAGKYLFDEIRLSCGGSPATRDMHSVLCPERRWFRLLTLSGELSLLPIEREDAYTSLDPDLDSDSETDASVDDDLPRYPPKEILVEEFFGGGEGAVCRALADDEEMVCNASPRDVHREDLQREHSCLRKLRAGDLHPRAPQLRGYVAHPSKGHPLGLLRDWITGSPLSDMDIPSTPEASR